MVFNGDEGLAENGRFNATEGEEKPASEGETQTSSVSIIDIPNGDNHPNVDNAPQLTPALEAEKPPVSTGGSNRSSPRILIIGAGMAGLCAARELQQRGYQTLVVEARHRPGGRLKAISFHQHEAEEQDIDVGGALIHGIVDNPLYEMVQEDMQRSTRSLSDCLLLSENGWPVDVALDERILQSFNDCLAETFQRIDTQTQDTQEKISFGSLFQSICQERHINVQQALFQWHKANLEISCGASFHNLGLHWNDDEPFGFDGDHVALSESWKPVCDSLASSLYILYNSPVRHIQIIHPPPKPPLTEAISSNHREEREEEVDTESSIPSAPALPPTRRPKRTATPSTSVAATTPSRKSRRLRGEDTSDLRRSERSNKGVLIRELPTPIVSPRLLPAAKRKRPEPASTIVQVTMQSGITWEVDAVVCTIPLGVLKDNSVTFDPPLPSEKQNAIQALGTGLLNKCVLTFRKRFWQNSDFLGLADASHSYLVLNAAKYTGKPVLLFMYGGSFAKEMEDWTDAAVVEDCLSVLRRMCGRDSVTPPLDYHVTRWGREPYARMSFTYVPPGVDGHSALSAMSQPIFDHTGLLPVLMFAGEHTTPYHPSTIHGAYFSGIREAYRWDCAWDPLANHGLEFSDEHVYQRTFAVVTKQRNVERAAKSPGRSARAISKASLVPPPISYRRRRGVNGEMTLRRRPKTYIQMSTSRSSRKVSNAEDVRASPHCNGAFAAVGETPVRQSPRRKVVVPGIKEEPVAEPSSTTQETPKKVPRERRLPLEQRILYRSLESVGPDFDYIQNVVFPAHESVVAKLPFKDVHQLEQRSQKFLEQQDKGMAHRQKIIRSWYKSWLATEVSPPSNVLSVPSPRKKNVTKASTSVVPSYRRKVQRTPISVTTRFGRTTKPPPL